MPELTQLAYWAGTLFLFVVSMVIANMAYHMKQEQEEEEWQESLNEQIQAIGR